MFELIKNEGLDPSIEKDPNMRKLQGMIKKYGSLFAFFQRLPIYFKQIFDPDEFDTTSQDNSLLKATVYMTLPKCYQKYGFKFFQTIQKQIPTPEQYEKIKWTKINEKPNIRQFPMSPTIEDMWNAFTNKPNAIPELKHQIMVIDDKIEKGEIEEVFGGKKIAPDTQQNDETVENSSQPLDPNQYQTAMHAQTPISQISPLALSGLTPQRTPTPTPRRSPANKNIDIIMALQSNQTKIERHGKVVEKHCTKLTKFVEDTQKDVNKINPKKVKNQKGEKETNYKEVTKKKNEEITNLKKNFQNILGNIYRRVKLINDDMDQMLPKPREGN